MFLLNQLLWRHQCHRDTISSIDNIISFHNKTLTCDPHWNRLGGTTVVNHRVWSRNKKDSIVIFIIFLCYLLPCKLPSTDMLLSFLSSASLSSLCCRENRAACTCASVCLSVVDRNWQNRDRSFWCLFSNSSKVSSCTRDA